MGRNFPEVLAKDLKNSTLLFTAKHIKPGPRELSLLADEPEIHDECPDMARSDRTPSCYQLPKLKRLSAVVPNLDPSTWLFEQDMDPASSSCSESSRSSFEMEPISIRPRQESAVTNTTFTSERSCLNTSQTLQILVADDRQYQKSWVDLEPDSTDAEAGTSLFETKPPTKSGSRSDPERKRSPPLSAEVLGTRRFFALQPADKREKTQCSKPGIKKTPAAVSLSTNNTASSVNNRPEDVAVGKSSQISSWRGSVSHNLTEMDTSLSLHSTGSMQFSSPVWRPSQDPQQGPPIPLPPDIVETLKVCTSSFPETMLLCSSLSVETIRAYSRKVKRPESSENNEARKLLLDGSATTQPSQPPTPPHSAGFSRWRLSSMLSPMKSSASFMTSSTGNSNNNYGDQPRQSTESNQSRNGRRSSKTQAGRGSSALAHPDFARFKSIFPGVADYLCDALYAHIVVYNYIVLFCGPGNFSTKSSRTASPRSATAAEFSLDCASRNHSSISSSSNSITTSSTTKTNTSPNKQNHKVPKKAAHVLGIARPATTKATATRPTDAFHTLLAEATRASLIRVSATDLEIVDVRPKKSGNSSNNNNSSVQSHMTMPRKHPRNEDDGVEDHDENASLRTLRDALGSCIVRLIKTMMLMSFSPLPSSCPDGGDIYIAPEGGRVGGTDAVDSLLVRTLCEMVKCCEDAD